MMTARKATCVLVVWALVAAGLSGLASARAPLGKWQREFDYFALALQWPGTICASTRHCCAKNGCCRLEPLQTFTIHGLWPDYDDGTWPSCCRYTNFEMEKILPLKEKLDKYWPSLYCSSSSTCFSGRGPFWAHEWEKHGTCSFPVVQDELQYFSTALDLYFKYNVMEMLSSGGIQISDFKEYALSDVIEAIKHAFGASPQIVCKYGSIEELRLCFDKDLKVSSLALEHIYLGYGAKKYKDVYTIKSCCLDLLPPADAFKDYPYRTDKLHLLKVQAFVKHVALNPVETKAYHNENTSSASRI